MLAPLSTVVVSHPGLTGVLPVETTAMVLCTAAVLTALLLPPLIAGHVTC